MPRIIDIQDNLEPKSDSEKLEFLTPLEGGVDSGGNVFIVNPSNGAPIRIDKSEQSVGTANYAPTYKFTITSNIDKASIYLNGQHTFKTSPSIINISVDEVVANGAYTITLQKDGYITNEKYVVEALFTPKYYKDDTFTRDLTPVDNTYNPYDRFGNPNFNQDTTARRTSEPVYVGEPAYTLRITKYENDIQTPYEYDVNSQIRELVFSNLKIIDKDLDEKVLLLPLSVSLNGDNLSSILLINNTQRVELNKGINDFNYVPGTKIKILSPNLENFRISSIIVTGENKNNIEAENSLESVTAEFELTEAVGVEITTNTITQRELNLPTIEFAQNLDEIKEYNINSKEGIGILLRRFGDVSNLRVLLNNQTIEFGNPWVTEREVRDVIQIYIPEKYFTTIGVYRVVIVASNADGDGEPIQCNINVVAKAWIRTPDIYNIVYPKNIKGKDYVGFDVDFDIAWRADSTDYVLIKPLGVSTSTKVQSQGSVTFNFKKLLELAASTVDTTKDIVPLTLSLTPYNTSGYEVVSGKEELITINFEKSKKVLPRNVAINRLVEGFLNQLDSSVFSEENSKYLTHLLHLGNGDNKIITTWVGDRESLILKLYEPVTTAVQTNQQVWISKIQSNPIVETITISGIETDVCPPLKGPNFSLEPDNGIGYTIFEDLVASGSLTSDSIANKFLEKSGIDTNRLNIQYQSGSFYTFENFSHFGSAAERAKNFFYKVQLIETLKARYETLITPPSFPVGTLLTEANSLHESYLTIDGYKFVTEDGLFDIQYEIKYFNAVTEANEAKRVLDELNLLLRNLDGFEKWMYSSLDSLAYPKQLLLLPSGVSAYFLKPTTDSDVISWYNALVAEAEYYDKYNANYLVNNIPEFVYSDSDNSQFLLFLDMIGQHFDVIWSYINALNRVRVVEERTDLGVPDDLIWHLLKSMGWDAKKAYDSQFIWEYAFGLKRDGNPAFSMPLEEANNQVWRRIINNLPYLLKHKGTARAMKAIMACYGVPQSMLTIMEFGGPQDPTIGGSREFTFDDRTAAIYLTESSSIKIPWKQINGNVPAAIEFNFKPATLPNTQYTLISSSQWTLDLIQTTGSFGKLELNFGGDLASSPYILSGSGVGYPYFETAIEYLYGPDLFTGSLEFPISTEYYSNVCINRTDYGGNSSLYEVWLGTSNGNRIITSVSMSIFTEDSQWVSGSSIQIGGNGYKGNVDEFRLWRVPLQRSKFNNHIQHPDSIAGNSYTASTEDLLFRLDFEYPKDRTADPYIKNVAINETYGEAYASASNMYSASSYPYQYTPYDRTVTATVPSLGFNYSNKIRFESSSLVTNLSHKVRATKKSFDRAPIDSSRLGLFFSPIKELNMDIIKAFGDFNIDNYIGDPSDEYRDNYKELEGLREYYFERLDRNVNEYIQLIRYINKSLFDVLADLAPARAKVSKGLLIEPHYLERSKTKWDKPIAEKNNFETSINTFDDVTINSTYDVYNGELNTEIMTTLVGDVNNYDTTINVDNITILDGTYPTYDSTINVQDQTLLEAEAPFYDVEIVVPNGATLTGEADAFTFEAIGMDKDSISNLGFGLYGKNGVGIYKKYDIFGNFTQSRQNIYLVKEQYTKKVSTQTSGYPTKGALPGEQVKYEDVNVNYNKFRVSIIPFSGSLAVGNNTVLVTPLNGYLPSHYRYTNNLSEGMQRSYWKGSQQTSATTPDGLSAVETFTTNPNILRVAKTGRGSGEPILEVD